MSAATTSEIPDEILFKQPDGNHHGDCPICCLPLPSNPRQFNLMNCCGKHICQGCSIANQKREIEGRLEAKCPFCRSAVCRTQEENIALTMKRIEVNDAGAMCQMGSISYETGDKTAALEYWTKAATLGNIQAHYELSIMYRDGEGVDKDEKKELHHSEQAAIAGHPDARYALGRMEWNIGRVDRAAKHWIIAAKLGHDISLENVKNLYKSFIVTKEEFAATLRGHHATIKATESDQRKEAAAIYKR